MRGHSFSDLLDELVRAAPELEALLRQHLADYTEVLSHVLMADVTRWLRASDPKVRVLDILERYMTVGDAQVQEVIALSFLENLEAEDYSLRAALGPSLSATLREMEEWTPGDLDQPT